MKILKRISVLVLAVLSLMPSMAKSGVVYQRQDSIRIINLLKQAKALKTKPANWMLWFGKQFVGIPYVGGTLDRTKEEVLIVNTRELDCTTYVEMVTALTMCAQKHETSFASFCEHLKHVRYVGGEVSYVKRQHYFTIGWTIMKRRVLSETSLLIRHLLPSRPSMSTGCLLIHRAIRCFLLILSGKQALASWRRA